MDGPKVVVLVLLVKVDTPRSAVSAIGHGFGTRDPKKPLCLRNNSHLPSPMTKKWRYQYHHSHYQRFQVCHLECCLQGTVRVVNQVWMLLAPAIRLSAARGKVSSCLLLSSRRLRMWSKLWSKQVKVETSPTHHLWVPNMLILPMWTWTYHLRRVLHQLRLHPFRSETLQNFNPKMLRWKLNSHRRSRWSMCVFALRESGLDVWLLPICSPRSGSLLSLSVFQVELMTLKLLIYVDPRFDCGSQQELFRIPLLKNWTPKELSLRWSKSSRDWLMWMQVVSWRRRKPCSSARSTTSKLSPAGGLRTVSLKPTKEFVLG